MRKGPPSPLPSMISLEFGLSLQEAQEEQCLSNDPR